MAVLQLTFILLISIAASSQQTSAQRSITPETDEASIDALYREWSQATATRGAEGYASLH